MKETRTQLFAAAVAFWLMLLAVSLCAGCVAPKPQAALDINPMHAAAISAQPQVSAPPAPAILNPPKIGWLVWNAYNNDTNLYQLPVNWWVVQMKTVLTQPWQTIGTCNSNRFPILMTNSTAFYRVGLNP